MASRYATHILVSKSMCKKLFRTYRPVSQSCAVAKRENFQGATAIQTASRNKSLFSCSHNCTLASGALVNSVCHVCLSSGLPE